VSTSSTEPKDSDQTETPAVDDVQEQAPDGTEQGQDATETASPNAEAARYRRQAREAQAERDTLREQLTTMQRGEAERLAKDARLADPSDLWRDGLTPADLLDDAGNLDHDKVTAAVAELVAAHPHWQAPVLGAGMRDATAGSDVSMGPSTPR